MARYVFWRVLWTVPLLIGVATIVFVLVELAPGDACTRLETPDMTDAAVCAMRCARGCPPPPGCECPDGAR